MVRALFGVAEFKAVGIENDENDENDLYFE